MKIAADFDEPNLRPASAPCGAFVGRERELDALSDLLGGGARAPGSACIEGEVGIGKSALVAEFLDRALEGDIQALVGRCYPVQETGPYFPFHQVLGQLASESSPPREVIEGLATNGLGGSHSSNLSDDVRGRRTQFLRRAAEVILRGTGGRMTFLWLEDIQWADTSSLLLANHLLDVRPSHLRIVCTVRPDEPVEAEARQLLAQIEAKGSRIILRGLDPMEAKEFLTSIAGPCGITGEEVQALHSFTNGNPLFLRELYLHLQETGLLERHSVKEAIARSRTPERLTHVIDLRVRSQPEEVNRALAAGSVIGGEFSAETVAQVLGEPVKECRDWLDAAVARKVLLRVDTPVSDRYRFAHPVFAMRLYDMLPPSTRRQIHRKLPETGSSGAEELPIEDLARHFALGFGATNGRRGMAYCRAAAESAEGVFAYETAARFWELGLTCAPPNSRRARADLGRRLGWALWAAGKWTRAIEAWVQAVELFEGLEDWEPVGELALALGEVLRWRQELKPAEHWLGRAVELLPEGSEDRSRALALLGSMRCLRDDPASGILLLEEASVAGEDGGRDPMVAYWLSFGFLTSGSPSRAYDIAKEGLAEAQRRAHSQAACLLAGFLANHELNNLQGDAAWSYLRVVQHHVDERDTTALIRSLLCEAWLAGYAGKWRDVVGLCERWIAQVRLVGRYQVATARVVRGDALLAIGDASGAAEEISLALPDLEQMQPLASLHLARALLRLGRQDEAGEIVARYAERVLGNPRYASGRAVLGDVVSSLQEPALWQECFDALKQEDRPMVVAYAGISTQRVLGRLASRLKLWPQAIEHFDTAKKQLAEGGARWELTRTMLDYAQMRRTRNRRGDTRKATALELEAAAILAELGIEPEHPVVPGNGGNRFDLTGREVEVLALVAEGRRSQEIADALTLSRRTVDRHLENTFLKMGVNTRTEAVVLAVQDGLVGPLPRR